MWSTLAAAFALILSVTVRVLKSAKPLISLKIVCYRLPLHSLRTFSSLICISIVHWKQSMFLLRAFPCCCFFYPEVKNLKLCPFVMNDLLQILSTSQTFNYCWPLLKLPLAFLLTSHGRLSLTMVSTKGWRWVFGLCPVILFCYEKRPKCYEWPT